MPTFIKDGWDAVTSIPHLGTAAIVLYVAYLV